MESNRVEAFSDSVMAIVITIMILDLKVPDTFEPQSLFKLLPIFLSYIMSFIFVGIYWANHHHLLHSSKTIDAGALWANLHFLFWISIIPFATAWMGKNDFEKNTVAFYSAMLLLNSIAFYVLLTQIKKLSKEDEAIQHAYKSIRKRNLYSIAGYAVSIPLAFVNPIIPAIILLILASLWVRPEQKIEKALADKN